MLCCNDVAVVLAGTAYRLKPVDNRPLLNWYGDTGHLMASLTPVCSELGQRRSASIDSSPSRGAVDSHHPTGGRNGRNAQIAVVPPDSRGVGHDRVLERLQVQRDWHLDNEVSRAALTLSGIPNGRKMLLYELCRDVRSTCSHTS
jgi:hypothetical protein